MLEFLQKHNPSIRNYFAIFTVAIVLIFFLRSHTFHEPLEADEALYSIIVKDWMEGGKPYITLWDNKPIGTFLIYRGAILLLGYNEVSPKIAATLSVMITSGLLLAIIIRCQLGHAVAVLLITLWALLSCSTSCYANGANSELFLLPFITGAWIFVYEYSRSGKTRFFWLAQFILTISLFIKQVTLPFFVIPFLIRGPEEAWKMKVAIIRVLGVSLMILISHLFVYTILGYSPSFLADQILQNTSYATQKNGNALTSFFTTLFLFPFDKAIKPLIPLTIVSIIGSLAYTVKDRTHFSWITLMFIIAAGFAIALPGENFPHYYILLLPLMLLGFICFLFFFDFRWQLTFLGLAVSFMIVLTYATYLSKHPNEISYRKLNKNNWFVRDRFIGMELKEVLTGKRIFVDGSHPGVIFYSGNKPATKYFVGWNYIAMRITTWDAIFQSLRNSPPSACILFNSPSSKFKNWLNATYELHNTIAGAKIFVLRLPRENYPP